MKVDVLGIGIDNIDMAGAVEKVLSSIKGDRGLSVFTPNAEMAMAAVKDEGFRSILNGAGLLIPDGAGVVLGAKLLGTPLKEKVAGIELVLNLLSSGIPLKVYLFGGSPGVAEKAALNIIDKYPNVKICGTEHGYHGKDKEEEIAAAIASEEPDLLLVGMGVPAQEEWIHKNMPRINTGTAIGCGGTLDFLAGEVSRTPEFMIKLNLEWLDRLIRQPKRIGRMMRIPAFLYLCFKKRLSAKAKGASS